jgi:hypothetical protein
MFSRSGRRPSPTIAAGARRQRKRAAGVVLPGMIRKLPSGQFRLYSRKLDPKTRRRRNLGTFPTRAAAEKQERAVQYFKRH